MGESNERASWNKVGYCSLVEKVLKDIEGNREEIMCIEKFGGYKPEVKEKIEIR